MSETAQKLRAMADREQMIAEATAQSSGEYTPEAKAYYDGVADGLRMAAATLDTSDS